jgi:hypothetical protein
MVDLKAECARLRELDGSRPTDESRRFAMEALQSKFESIQVEGGKLLGRWGGPGAATALREWLFRLCQKPKAHAVQKKAADALAPWLTADDAVWALDLYFSRPKSSDAYFLLPIVCALPWQTFRPRVAEEARSSSVIKRRAAARLVARRVFPGRRDLLLILSRDTDQDVRSLAAWHLSREKAAV